MYLNLPTKRYLFIIYFQIYNKYLIFIQLERTDSNYIDNVRSES